VLIKTVTQAIPTYAMSMFKVSQELCNPIHAMITGFWWGHKQEERKCIGLVGQTCVSKKRMGAWVLGIWKPLTMHYWQNSAGD